MKINLKLLFILSGLSLAGCSDGTSDKDLPMPNIKGRPEVVNLVSSSWGKMLERCPGLSKYQDEIRLVAINDMLDPYVGRVDIEFVVDEDARRIPRQYRAWGHHCHFGISADGQELSISKRACISICQDREISDPDSNYVVRLDN